MKVRELIKLSFGVDLPIRGGIGDSIDNPVIIENSASGNYVAVEHDYLNFLCIGRQIPEWKIVRQTLMGHKGRKIDQLKFQYPEWEDGQKYLVTENFYFDITECFGIDQVPSDSADDAGEASSANIMYSAKKFNLIEKFFDGQLEYLKFLTGLKESAKANKEATCIAQLTKEEGGYYKYILTWVEDKNKFIGDYVIPFPPTAENVKIFNKGCEILAHRLAIFIETNDAGSVPENPPAFGELTHIM